MAQRVGVPADRGHHVEGERDAQLETVATIVRLYGTFLNDASETEKLLFIESTFSLIPFNLIWHDKECHAIWRTDPIRTWSAEDARIAHERVKTESPEAFREGNARMQSWGQVTWYFERVLLHNHIRAIPVSEWWQPYIVVGSEKAVARAIQFILAVYWGAVTKETFESFAPDGDLRPMVVDALWVHVDRILEELAQIRKCIINTLKTVIKRDQLELVPVTAYISPGPVQETWMSDQLIADELKHKFVAEVAVLESVPDDEKDWHPESNNQVLDLVFIESMQRMLFMGSELVENPHRGDAKFQWIPTDVSVDASGRSTIVSYINNLHPHKHSGMYDSIARIFDAFVPLFDRVLSCLRNSSGPPPEMKYKQRDHDEIQYVPMHPRIPETLNLDPRRITYSLRDRTVQVIFKIAEIRLTSENPTYPGGTWHVEGSDAEQIVAAGIYYFGCENITESKLAFRAIVREPPYPQDDREGMRAMYGLTNNEPLVQHLGSVTAFEDRCIVFPNTLQHHVEPFELEVKTKPGVRKILAFFLVDPSKRIPSTSLIPPQRADWILEGLDPVLDHLRETKALPEGVVDKTVASMVGTRHGMTLEEAKQHRLALMAERKPNERTKRELNFSLCEH